MHFLADHVLRCLRSTYKPINCWAGWKLVFIAVVLADLILFVPFTSYELMKTIKNETWYNDNHEVLGVVTTVHTNSAMILALLAMGILRCNAKVQTAITIAERSSATILLLLVMYSTSPMPWENGMNWFTILFGLQGICMGVLSCMMPKLKKKTQLIPTYCFLLQRTWVPAVIFTAISTAIMACYSPIFTDLHLSEQILYTLGMEVLLASMYFIPVYDKFEHCEEKHTTPESSRADEILQQI